jgi:hypothetical protein
MTPIKKYDYRVVQNGKTWTAEITRRATSKKTVISKSQDGFASEAEAKAWGEEELKSFLENLGKRNKRDSEEYRQAQKEKADRQKKYARAKKD